MISRVILQVFTDRFLLVRFNLKLACVIYWYSLHLFIDINIDVSLRSGIQLGQITVVIRGAANLMVLCPQKEVGLVTTECVGLTRGRYASHGQGLVLRWGHSSVLVTCHRHSTYATTDRLEATHHCDRLGLRFGLV